jgi:hypothetical protein
VLVAQLPDDPLTLVYSKVSFFGYIELVIRYIVLEYLHLKTANNK